MSTTDREQDYRNMNSNELERETAAERERIATTVAALQEKLSMKHIVDEALHQGATYGADVSRSFGRALRDNPVPAALIGIGLVWLMAKGNSATNHYRSRYYDDHDLGYEPGLDEEDYIAAEREAYYRTNAMAEVRDGMAARMEPQPRSLSAAASNGGGPQNSTGSDDARHKAREYAEDAAEGARRRAEQASNKAGEYADEARGMASRGYHRAQDALHEGADRLSEAYYGGRRRAAHAYDSAQHAAYDAYEEARIRARRAARATRRQARYAGDAVSDFVHEQPLVAGGIALAIGAAIGGLLPRTRLEDEYIGETSDYVKESARDTVREEARRARRVAEAAVNEARHVAEEAADTISENVPSRDEVVKEAKSRVKKAADRVEGAAEKEAEKQGLTQPKKTTTPKK